MSCLVEVYVRESLSVCRQGATRIVCWSSVVVCREQKDGAHARYQYMFRNEWHELGSGVSLKIEGGVPINISPEI